MQKNLQLILVSALFFVCGESSAQFTNTWDVTYQHTSANNFSNESRKVAVDASGDIFVLADATSDLDLTGNVSGTTHHYTILLKYSTNGTILQDTVIEIRDHSVTGFDNKSAFGLELDNSGQVFIGYSTYDGSTDFDVVISKYTNNLSPLWEYRYNSPSADYGVDMKIAQGNAYAIVKTISGINTQFHIIKANSQNISSTPYYSFDMDQDYLSSMAMGTFQSVYVTGYSLISGAKNLLTAKVANGGILKWNKTLNGGSVTGDDYGNHISVGADNNIYVTGSSYRNATLGYDVITAKYLPGGGKKEWTSFLNHGMMDAGYFVYCVDTGYAYVGSVSGNEILLDQIQVSSGGNTAKQIYEPYPISGFTSLDGASLVDMKISLNKNFYLTGNIIGTDNGQSFSSSFLIKYYLDDRILDNVGGSTLSRAFNVLVEGDFSQSYSVAGIAFDNTKEDLYWLRSVFGDFANHQQESILLNDFDIPPPVRYANPRDLSPDTKVSVFPNPSNTNITFFSDDKIDKIEIVDFTGKIVKTVLVNSENIKIDISDLVTGIYLARLYSKPGDILIRKIAIK